jgi:hypothetical protein
VGRQLEGISGRVEATRPFSGALRNVFVGHHPGVPPSPPISSKSFDPLLSSGGWSVLDKSPKEISSGNGHEIDAVTENDEVSSRNWEGNLSERGVEGFSVGDGTTYSNPIGERESLVGELLQELNGIVSSTALSVGGNDEDCGASFGEVFKVVFLWTVHEGSGTKLRLGFLCNPNGVLSGTGLRATEDHQSLVLNIRGQTDGRPWLRWIFCYSPPVIFATRPLGFLDPSPSSRGVVGTVKDFELGKIWSRERCVADATMPTPTTIGSASTMAGIIGGG